MTSDGVRVGESAMTGTGHQFRTCTFTPGTLDFDAGDRISAKYTITDSMFNWTHTLDSYLLRIWVVFDSAEV